MMIVT